jgi:hypothetical protein
MKAPQCGTTCMPNWLQQLLLITLILAVEHVMFWGLMLLHCDRQSVCFGVWILCWFLVPIFTTTILTANYGWPILGGAYSSAMTFIVLSFAVGTTHKQDPLEFPPVWVIYIFLMVIMTLFGGGCGGYVRVVCEYLDRKNISSLGRRILYGIRKGATFAVICVAATLPVAYVLQPSISRSLPHSEEARREVLRQEKLHAVYWLGGYSILFMLGGTTVGGIVGATYRRENLLMDVEKTKK